MSYVILIIMTTTEVVVCTSPGRAYYQRRLKAHRNIRQPHNRLQAAAKAGLFLCLCILTTRKRVHVLLERYLVFHNILLKLIFNVFLYHLFVPSYCIHIISSAPKMSVPVFIL